MEYDDINFDEDIDLSECLDMENIANSIQKDVDIEKLVMAIQKGRQKVEFLKKLKKNRMEPIDSKIEHLTQNEEKLRNLILDLMPKLFPKQNSVDFPGVGNISKRKTKGKWVITDEQLFTEVLKKYNLYDEVVNVKVSVDKKKLPNAVARILADANESSLSGVEFQTPERDSSLVLKIYGEEAEAEDSTNNDAGF